MGVAYVLGQVGCASTRNRTSIAIESVVVANGGKLSSDQEMQIRQTVRKTAEAKGYSYTRFVTYCDYALTLSFTPNANGNGGLIEIMSSRRVAHRPLASPVSGDDPFDARSLQPWMTERPI
jgi:hypothetical protein